MEQRTPEWYAARKSRVTASIVGGLLDCAPYMSKDDAFRALVRSCHDLPSEFKGNIATEYGQANEDMARVSYEMETGNTVKMVGFVPMEEWAGASPDGLICDDGLLEIKCPFGKRKDNPPVFASIDDQPHYYAQMQFQMFCTGRVWCDFWQWSAHGSRLDRVPYSPAWINENLPRLRQLWAEAMDADLADYDGPSRKVIDTPEAARLVAEYDDLGEAMDRAKERRNEVLLEMVRIAGEKDALVAGRNLTLTKRKGSVAYAKALAKAAPDFDVEPFRGNASESWGLK